MKVMSVRWLYLISAGFALALVFVTMGEAAAECNQLLATIDKPALVTVAPAEGVEGNGKRQTDRIVLSVTCFQPAPDGSAVQVVVNAQKPDGTEQEVGRFTPFPQTAFKAGDSSKSQNYGLSLPKELMELASSGRLNLKVQLVKLRGEGKGARLEVGGVEWETSR